VVILINKDSGIKKENTRQTNRLSRMRFQQGCCWNVKSSLCYTMWTGKQLPVFQRITRPSECPQLFTSWHSIRSQKMWIISSNLTMQYIFQSFLNILESSALNACHYDDVLWHSDMTQDGDILIKFFALTSYMKQYRRVYLSHNTAVNTIWYNLLM
jgi:hypothetical protein